MTSQAPNFFSSNIRLLRKRKGKTQDDVAFALGMKRSTLSGYENEVAQPGIPALVQFSTYFGVAVDTLIRVDLSQLGERELSQLERGYDVHVHGTHLRVLATTVNAANEDNIELVPEKAQAGYRKGFADPEFIQVLPAFQLPFLSRHKKYRTFQISGDSMLPIPDGAWITGEYVEDWLTLRDRMAYIILTLDEGIVFKVVENRISQDARLVLYSLNPAYDPYEVDVKNIREIWRFVHYISEELPGSNVRDTDLASTVAELRRDVGLIKSRILKLDL
ncbi:MAG TPA: LexA family transcriptional regulator [Bacteroidales bacterium]|nr:LexA family transcriptional regulator [Lentimicrobiaceae bacterium]HOI00996.1 LexA family transcriptional regulator [Bacteroidales bacterium]